MDKRQEVCLTAYGSLPAGFSCVHQLRNDYLELVLASWIIDIAALFVKLMSGAVPKKRKAQFQIGVEQKGG